MFVSRAGAGPVLAGRIAAGRSRKTGRVVTRPARDIARAAARYSVKEASASSHVA
jgi:hypothetical protein